MVSYSNNRQLLQAPNFKESEFKFGAVVPTSSVRVMAWACQVLRQSLTYGNGNPTTVKTCLWQPSQGVATVTLSNYQKIERSIVFRIGQNGKLAYPPNFSQGEFTRRGAVAVLPQHEPNLLALAWVLQMMRSELFGNRPVTITSGYRSLSEFNRIQKWNPSPDSYHNSGLAADIVVAGMHKSTVQSRIGECLLPLGVGNPKRWEFTHINLEPRYRFFAY